MDTDSRPNNQEEGRALTCASKNKVAGGHSGGPGLRAQPPRGEPEVLDEQYIRATVPGISSRSLSFYLK